MSVVQLGLSAIIGLVGIVVAQSLKLELAVSAIVGVVGAIVGFLVAGSLVAGKVRKRDATDRFFCAMTCHLCWCCCFCLDFMFVILM